MTSNIQESFIITILGFFCLSLKKKKVLHEGLGIICMSMREASLLADSCTLAPKDSQRTKFILECLRFFTP